MFVYKSNLKCLLAFLDLGKLIPSVNIHLTTQQCSSFKIFKIGVELLCFQFQRENSKKRLEGHQIESNGSSGNLFKQILVRSWYWLWLLLWLKNCHSFEGLFGLHIPKKPKILRPSLENSFDNMSPVTGSIPSPAASQMSNMSNPNKIMKVLNSRDRSRKGKNLKVQSQRPNSFYPLLCFYLPYLFKHVILEETRIQICIILLRALLDTSFREVSGLYLRTR